MGNPKASSRSAGFPLQTVAKRHESPDTPVLCHKHEKNCHVVSDIAVTIHVKELMELMGNAYKQVDDLKRLRCPDKTKYMEKMMDLLEKLAPVFQTSWNVTFEEDGNNEIHVIEHDEVCQQANTDTRTKVKRLLEILPDAKEEIDDLIKNRHCHETVHIRSMMAFLIGISEEEKGGKKSKRGWSIDTNKYAQRQRKRTNTLQNKKKQTITDFETCEDEELCFSDDLILEVKRYKQEITAKDEQIHRLLFHNETEKKHNETEKNNLKVEILKLAKTVCDQKRQMRILLEREKEKCKEEKETLNEEISSLKYSLAVRDRSLETLQLELQRQTKCYERRFPEGTENYLKRIKDENKNLKNQVFHEQSKYNALNDMCANKIRVLQLQISEKDKTIQNFQTDIQVLVNMNSQLRETINQLHQEKKNLGSMNSQLRGKFDHLHQENRRLSESKLKTDIELQRSRDDLQRVTHDNKVFKSNITSLKNEMEKLNDSVTSEKEHFKTKEGELRCITASVKRELEDKDTELANLRHLMKANEEPEPRIYQLQSGTRHRQLYENIKKLEKSREDLKQKLKCIQEENDLLREQNINVSKNLLDKEQQMKRKENDLKIERSEVETLKTEVTRLTKQLQTVNNEVTAQTEEVHNLQQEKEKLKQILEEMTKRSKSEQNLQEVQSRDQQRQLEVKVDEIKEINNKLNQKIETLMIKCEQLVHEKTHLNDELLAEKQRIQRKEIELQNTYSDIEKLKTDLSRQEVQVSDLNIALSYEKERLRAKEKECAGIILSTKQLNQQSQTLRENLEEEFMSKVRTLETDCEHKQTKFEEQVSELRQNEETLNKRLKILKIQCHQLEQDKSKLTEDIMSKQQHLKKQEIDLHDLRLELAELDKAKERLQKEVSKSKQLQNSLADKLKQKESSSEQEIERMKYELTEQSKSLQTECHRLKQRNLKLEEQVAKEKGNFEKQVFEYQQRILDLDTNNKEMKQELATQKHEIQSTDRLTDRLHTLEDRIDQLTNEKGELIKQSTERENMISSQKETLDRLRQDNAKLNEDLRNKKNTRDQVDKKYADKIVKLENALASVKQELNSVQSTNAQLRNQDDQYKQQMKIYQSENEKLVEKVQKEEKSLKREKDMNVKLQDENQKLQKKVQQLSRGDSSNSALQQQCFDLREQLKLAHKELDETKSRLSRAMGDRLTDNNPNITDLSDKNRPTKISERYQELYDNQWTDAFEVIDKDFGKEEQTIKALKDILTETVKFCKLEATKQIQQMTEALSKGKDVPAHIMKQLKDTRKALAERYGKELYKEYVDQLRRSKSDAAKMALKVPLYLQECFEICWLMAVQDPPVVFGPDVLGGGAFNKDHYKAYTKGGDTVKFVVWPVLLLHEGGPVLCKGVAQG